MIEIPVTFEYEGKEYKGLLGQVAGAGGTTMFYLTVDKYHWGQLWFVEGHEAFPPPGPPATDPGWRFGSNHKEKLSEPAEYFECAVTAWLDSHPE